MKELNNIVNELGISKVSLAKYLGVSRQMLYNYLAFDKVEKWPKEKLVKILNLLNIEKIEDIKKIDVTNEYITDVNERLDEGVKSNIKDEVITDLKCFNRKEQEILSDIINLLKEKLENDNSKETYNTYIYLYHFIQSMDQNPELKYFLGYASKALGFTNPMEFVFSENKQFIFESIMFSALTIYNSGDASKNRITETHKKFVEDIEHKEEEKLSRTQELNANKLQALKELGYTEITPDNAKEVLEKMAEIETRKV